jgi:hypothetical protein
MLLRRGQAGGTRSSAVFEGLQDFLAWAVRRFRRQNRSSGRISPLEPREAAHALGQVGQRDRRRGTLLSDIGAYGTKVPI